jgi:hypothetical protein
MNRRKPNMRGVLIFVFLAIFLAAGIYAQQPVVVTGSRSTNFVMQNNATTGNGTTVNVTGLAGVRVTVNCAATSTVVIVFEAQNDAVNFGPVAIIKSDALSTVATGVVTCPGGAGAVTNWYIPVGGYLGLRARITGGGVAGITVTATVVPVSNALPFTNATIVSGSGFTPGQITVGNTATLIVAARSGRVRVTIQNMGTTVVYLGGSTVTTATGFRLPGVDGSAYTTQNSAAIYGIVAAGTQAVSFIEEY